MNLQSFGNLKGRSAVDAAAVGGLVLVSLLTYFVGVAPALEVRQVADAAATALENTALSVKTAERSAASLKQEIVAVRGATEAAGIALVKPQELTQLLSWMTELAAKHRLRIDGIEPGALTPAGRTAKTPIRIAGRGGYRACALFLHDLHEARPDATVVGVQLATPAGTNDAGGSFLLDLIWHTLPQPQN